MGHGLRECRRLTDQTFNAGLLGGLQLHLVAFLLHHLVLLLLLHLQLETQHSHASPSAGNTTQSCFIFSWQQNTVMLHLQLATQHSHASSSASNTTVILNSGTQHTTVMPNIRTQHNTVMPNICTQHNQICTFLKEYYKNTTSAVSHFKLK